MAQVAYSTAFETVEEFNEWTVIDSNEDQSSWSFDIAASPGRVFYSYNSTNAANDWLISPAITVAETGMVAINFKVQGSTYVEKLQVFKGTSTAVESMTEVSEVLVLEGEEKSFVYLTDVTANEPFHLAFKACSDADRWRLYLCSVTVQFTSNPVDLQVTKITSPESGFDLGNETVTVTVKNAGQTAVESFNVSYSVDDVEVATETVNQPLGIGEETEYTFATTADLSTPRHLFAIKAWTSHSDDINPGNDAATATVLHKAPASVPYSMGFEASEYTEGITFFNLNEDEGNWDLYADPWWSLAHSGDYCLAYNYDKNNAGNDWAILEPITISEPGHYVLKFWYSGDDTHPEKLGVYYGEECSPEGMTNKIVEHAPFARSAYEESINIIYIDAPKTIYIGFHAFSDKDENWLCVDDVSFEKIDSDDIDLGVTGINFPGEYIRKGTHKHAKYSVRNYGIADENAILKVSIDGVTLSEGEITFQAQHIHDFELQHPSALSILDPGMHTITVEVISDNDKVPANNVLTQTFRVLDTPTKLWDFEDGEIPSDFTFRTEDTGTVNPAAGSEFNEYGWGIFNIQEHDEFGSHMFAGTSWLDGTDKADRWCILPPYIADETSVLAWDVASFNPNFLESYSIMISTNGDEPWYYFAEKEFHLESAEFKLRGVDLSSYAGNEIYIAFRLRSKNCEHLILDNISLHGGAITSEIAEIEDSNVTVSITDDAIIALGADVKEIAVYGVNGTSVATSATNSVAIGNLAPAVYMVRVTTETGEVITKKFMKK